MSSNSEGESPSEGVHLNEDMKIIGEDARVTIRLGSSTDDERDCFGVNTSKRKNSLKQIGDGVVEDSSGAYVGKPENIFKRTAQHFLIFPFSPSEYTEYAEQLDEYQQDDAADEIEIDVDDPENEEVDIREARLVMQVELLSHLLRTVSTEILQIPPKPKKEVSEESHFGMVHILNQLGFN